MITGDVAYRLNISIGDKVNVSTPFWSRKTEVSGIIREFGSSEAYLIDKQQFFNGALIKVEAGNEKLVEKEVKKLSFISSWVFREELSKGWLSLLDEYYSMVYAMDFITVTLVLIIVGVFSFISTLEKEWDYTILKSMGYSDYDILKHEIAEVTFLTSIGIIFSIPLTIKLTLLFNKTFERLIYLPIAVLNPSIVLGRAILVLLTTMFSVYLISKLILHGNIAEKLRVAFESM